MRSTDPPLLFWIIVIIIFTAIVALIGYLIFRLSKIISKSKYKSICSVVCSILLISTGSVFKVLAKKHEYSTEGNWDIFWGVALTLVGLIWLGKSIYEWFKDKKLTVKL
jgi:uncharacterized membrane protein